MPISEQSIQKSLLAMLYWAEGTKSDKAGCATFANTDPDLIRLYLSLLRDAFLLDESRLGIRLHLHEYHDREASLSFWSGLTRVPESQFGKIYVKKRSTRKKFRENFQGICFVIYCEARVRRELLALGQILAERQTGSRRSMDRT